MARLMNMVFQGRVTCNTIPEMETLKEFPGRISRLSSPNRLKEMMVPGRKQDIGLLGSMKETTHQGSMMEFTIDRR